MEIRFASFEDYLKSLSRVSRDGIKRNFKKIAARVPLDLEITRELAPAARSEAHRLYLQTVAKSEVQFETAPELFFERVAKNLPDNALFFLWRLQGKTVAFAFCLVSQDRFIDYYLGFDYAVAYDYHLYFIRFRDLMNWCIQNKIKKYEMGNTGYEAKRRLGFDWIPLDIYAKHRNPWVNPFFKILCFLLRPENFEKAFEHMKSKSDV